MIFCFLVATSVLFASDHTTCYGAQQIIQQIAPEERSELEAFFRKLLFSQGFAYTLYGDKPVSIECFDIENPNKPELFLSSPQGYRIWEKYAHLLPKEKFIFLFYEDLDEELCEISLINVARFHEIIDKHKEKFSQVFGPDLTSEELLNLLVKRKSLWNTPLKDRDDLLGILLGYGQVNAELFQKRSEIVRRRQTIKKNRTSPSPGYDSVQQELEALNVSLQAFSREGKINLHYMRLPSFVAVSNHPETIRLKKKYKQQRKWITQHYSEGDALEITLKQLCEEGGGIQKN